MTDPLDFLTGINDPILRRARWLNDHGDAIVWAACALALVGCVFLI